MGDFYTLIMIVDITNSPKDLKEIQEDIDEIGDKMKIKVYLQHEDVFRYMHRIQKSEVRKQNLELSSKNLECRNEYLKMKLNGIR